MKIYFLLIAILAIASSLFAQPDGYYDNAFGKSGEELQQALHDIIDNHAEQSYTYLWTAFKTTDDKADGTVWDMYSDNPDGEEPYVYTFVNDQCGNYSGEGSCYNREHSFPKSWFGDIAPMNTDLFHLYPTDGSVNGMRGNYPYGETDNHTKISMNGSKLGPCSVAGYTGTIFEPIDEYKGDFARTYFYMATRYYGEDSNWSGSLMVDGSQLLPWAETMLIQWHQDDPVSMKEEERNDAVFDIQGNRNPFIDNPDYVALLYGGEIVIMPECVDDIVTMYGGSSFSYLVLFNDILPGAINVSVNQQPAHGTATLESDNSITYYPESTFNQAYDTIGYKVCMEANPGACDSALMVIFVDRTIGLEIERAENEASIYPNPNNGEFYVRLSGEQIKISSMKLHDMLGRNISFVEDRKSNLFHISVSVKSGVYHLNLMLENGVNLYLPVLVQ